jgi:hypothetical protein
LRWSGLAGLISGSSNTRRDEPCPAKAEEYNQETAPWQTMKDLWVRHVFLCCASRARVSLMVSLAPLVIGSP